MTPRDPAKHDLELGDTIAASTPPEAGATPSATEPGPAASNGPDGGGRQVLAGRYELLGLLGAGGMGNVYRARDRELDEVVALKVLRPEIGGAPGMLERFRREVKLSRRVTHPNVARVFDIGEHGGERFLTMELVDGEPLSALLSRRGPLGVDRAAEIVRAVCAGLSAAHAVGVVHRDLKPDNVLLAKGGRVVLTDFGIARALDGLEGGKTVGAMLGTPAYMAPEQVEGASDIDGRADIYALGVMLYEMLTGERLWRGDGLFAVAAARLLAEPPDPRTRRPDLPDALARLVLRCLARSRDERIASADLVATELASLAPLASGPPAAPDAACCTPAAPAPPRADKTVAVLPFRNRGGAADEYLADELTDDLIDTLSMTRGLKVRPRGVVAPWKGLDQDPREIGRELGVQVVADGSVRRRAGAVRISARLVSVADGFQLWAHRFDRPEQEVLRINDEVAQAIVEALTLEPAAPCCRPPADAAALDLFLRGRHEFRKFLPPNIAQALALFEQALARAPGDPMILSACAMARSRLAFFTGQGADVAEQTALAALAAAPDLPEAHLALGSVRLQVGDPINAVRHLKQALRRGPGVSDAHSFLARLLGELGATEEAFHHTEAAMAIEGRVSSAMQAQARTLALLGRWEEAEALLDDAIQTEGTAGLALLRMRFAIWRRDEARARALQRQMIDLGVVLDSPGSLFDMFLGRRMMTEVAGAPGAPSNPGAHSRRWAFMEQMRAEEAALHRNVDDVLAALERAADAGLFDLLWLERCPLFDEVRAHPRYAAVHADVKRRADAILAVYRAP